MPCRVPASGRLRRQRHRNSGRRACDYRKQESHALRALRSHPSGTFRRRQHRTRPRLYPLMDRRTACCRSCLGRGRHGRSGAAHGRIPKRAHQGSVPPCDGLTGIHRNLCRRLPYGLLQFPSLGFRAGAPHAERNIYQSSRSGPRTAVTASALQV